MKAQAILLLLFTITVVVYGRPEGAPSAACSTLIPQHPGPEQGSSNPYQIDLSALSDGGGGFEYTPGQTYQLTLSGSNTFRGFFIQGRLISDDSSPAGTFSSPSSGTRLSSCSPSNIGVTHNSRDDKSSVTVTWTAPSAGTGPIRFGYAVVQEYTIWWANDRTDVIQEAVDCGTLSAPLNGLIDLSGGTIEDAVATYSCNTGYTLNGLSTRTCQADGTWSGSEPTCQIVDCGTLNDPTDGQVSFTTTTFNSTATYSCNTGYNLQGVSTRTCQADGTWSDSEPTCQIVDCGNGTLNDPTDGQVSFTTTTFNSTATYSCNTGYNLQGVATRTCQADGTWSDSEPTCQIVDCGNGTLNDPTDGQVSFTTTTFNSTATYSCNTGYNLQGVATRTCQADGTWSDSEPTCQIVDCGNGTLNDPTDGQVSFTTTTFNSTATYSCNTGYNLLGVATRTCQADGTWSDSEPTCQIVDCGNGTLNDPTDGQVSFTTTTFSSTATYSCNNGYNLQGVATRTCQADGTWSDSEPTCQIVDCGTLNDPTDGQVSFTTTTFSSTATYSCNTGYDLQGVATRTCQADGTWSDSEPTCQIVDCGTLSDPVNGQVSFSSTTYNSVATYTCSIGILQGDSSRICQADGSWSGSEPFCLIVVVQFTEEEYQAEVNETFVSGGYPRPSPGFITVSCTGGINTTYSICVSEVFPFDIDSATGELSVTEDLDYDTGTTSYSFNVTCFEAFSSDVNDTATILVTLLPVNEFAPTAGASTVLVLVLEDTPIGTVIASNADTAPEGVQDTYDITDDDAGPDGILTFTSDDIDTEFFTLDITTGSITLLRDLDLDNLTDTIPTSFIVSVTGCDILPPVVTCPNVAVRIFVSQVNEFQPQFSQDVYNASIAETASEGTEVVDVSCTDGDVGVGAVGNIEFLNPSQQLTDAFMIDSSTGSITLIVVSYEAIPTYEFMVRCVDTGGLESFANVSIDILPATVSLPGPALDLDTTSDSNDTSIVFYEEDGRVKLLSGTSQSLTDPGSTTITRATFTIVYRPDGFSEYLDVDEASLEGLFVVTTPDFVADSTTGTLTVQGTYTLEQYLVILRAIDYVNSDPTPAEVERQVSIQIQDDNEMLSDPVFVNISVELYNNPPEIFLGGAGVTDYTVTFTEEGECVSIVDPSVQIIDLDSTGIGTISVMLESSESPYESITILGDTSSYPATTYLLSSTEILLVLVNTQTSSYEEALPSIVYCNTADEPTSTPRTVRFIATDLGLLTNGNTSTIPEAMSTPVFTTINIVTNNDPPVLTLEPVSGISAGPSPIPIVASGFTDISDADSILFDMITVAITNHQDGLENEIIQFSSLPSGAVSVGPSTNMDGDILYTVSFSGGTNDSTIITTIDNIRYSNQASNVTVEPPRIICLQIRDIETAFSIRSCVTVVLSPPNTSPPMFSEDFYSSSVDESSSPIGSVAAVSATDNDAGLAGSFVYSIIVDADSENFEIDPNSGDISAPLGLDAETASSHNLTVGATDLGNPSLTGTASVIIDVQDVNDNGPVFTQSNYSASIEENVPIGTMVTTVSASDTDRGTGGQVLYGIVSPTGFFTIIPNTGEIVTSDFLDAELIPAEHNLIVSASDSGNPVLSSFATLTITVTQVNDNGATLDISNAYYLSRSEPTFQLIAATAQIVDSDPFISEINITLTPNAAEANRPYNTCMSTCQGERLQEAGLLNGALDLLGLTTFLTDVTSNGTGNATIGDGNCSAVTLQTGTIRDEDGYGRIPNTSLPADFGSANYSVSFVATIKSDGFIFLIVSNDDLGAPTSRVDYEVALYFQNTSVEFHYLYSDGTPGSATYTLQQSDPFTEFFPIDGEPVTRHYVLVISSTPTPFIELYIDCSLLTTQSLSGVVDRPAPQYDLFIGQSRPPAISEGRLDADIHGLYYHSDPLTASEILDFCRCGREYLDVQSVLPSTVDAITEQTHISLRPSSGDVIPRYDAVSALRQITYTNTFTPPTFDPPRRIDFTLSEDPPGFISFLNTSLTVLAGSENPQPVLDLNGVSDLGIDYSTTFTEDGGPIPLVFPNALLIWEGIMTDTPTFTSITVQLLNAVDSNECISAIPTTYINVENNGSKTINIVGPGSGQEFLEVLRSLTYDNPDQTPTITSRQVSFSILDTLGISNSPLSYTLINITATSDPPEIEVSGERITFTEATSGVLIAPDLNITDIDNDMLLQATIRLYSPSDEEDITYSGPNILSTNYDAASKEFTFFGEAPISTYQNVIRNTLFVSMYNPPLDGNGLPVYNPTRNITIMVMDAGGANETAEVQLDFIPVNDPPRIDLNSTTIIFTGSNESPLSIFPSADIIDPDNTVLLSMTITLSNGVENDYLSDGTLNSRILLYGEDQVSDYITTLRNINYVNSEMIPVPVPRNVTVQVCDFAACDTAYILIDVDPLVCEPDTCLNGGTCIEEPALETSCICYFRFTGESCETAIPVTISSSVLDFNTGILLLEFSDEVNTSTFTASLLTILDGEPTTNSYTLTGAAGITLLVDSSSTVEIFLLLNDLDNIKANPNLATTQSNTYLAIGDGLFIDTLGFPTQAAALPVSVYIEDTTSPEIVSFELQGISEVVLAVSFSETVLVNSVMLDGFTLLDSPNSNNSYTLTGGALLTVSAYATEIRIELTDEDVAAIKDRYPLASTIQFTYLSVNAGVVTDANGNPCLAIPPEVALLVTNITVDLDPPRVSEFSLDLNTGTLSVTFNEAVNITTIDLSLALLQNSLTNPSAVQSLSNSEAITGDVSDVVNIELSSSDLDGVKIGDLATDLADSYLAIQQGLIADTLGNLARTQELQASLYIPDVTQPELVLFDFDLNDGILTMSFNEPLNASSFQLDQLVLSPDNDNNDGDNTTFSPSESLSSLTGRTATVIFTLQELNEIKRLEICINQTSCYLYFPRRPEQDTGRDYSGNAIVAISSAEAIVVSTYTMDITPPQLDSFTFDLDLGTVTLSFSETVALLTLDITQMTLQNLPSTSILTITGGEFDIGNYYYNSDVANIVLTQSDLNQIKAIEDLCTNDANCLLSFTSDLVRDVVGNEIIAILPMNVSVFISDITQPNLLRFTVDFTEGTVTLYFSETVAGNTFVPQTITFQAAFQSYTLTGGDTSGGNAPSLTFSLALNDLNNLKANTDLATNSNDTFIRYTSEMIADTNGNPISPSAIEGVQVDEYTPDTIRPNLVTFSLLDMDRGQIQLLFSEPVDETDITFTGITICSNVNCSVSYSLTDLQRSVTFDGLQLGITIELLPEDVRGIKVLYPVLASSSSNSFIALALNSFYDTSGNGIDDTSPVQVLDFIDDSTQPFLVEFGLDLNSGILQMTFDDVMNASSVNLNAVTLQNEQAQNASSTIYGLTSGMVDGGNDISLTIQLNEVDFTALTSLPTLATTVDNTFIAFTEFAFRDVNDNLVFPIPTLNALQATTVTLDNPLLVAFTFDLNEGILVLSFSEDIDPTTLTESLITIQDAPLSTFSYTLSQGVVLNAEESVFISLELGQFDLNNIKALTQLATSVSDTYLTVGGGLVNDPSGNPALPIPDGAGLLVASYTFDTTQPEVVGFELRSGSGAILVRRATNEGTNTILEVTFSESVDVSTVDPTGFTLLESPQSSNTVTLTGGTVSSGGSPEIIEICITSGDVAAIRASYPLATSPEFTYLTVAAGAVADTTGNLAAALLPNASISAGNITADLTPPSLAEFTLDMDSGRISLTFNEDIVPSSLDIALLSLQNTAANAAVTQSLIGSDVIDDISTQLDVQLSESILDEVKAADIASSVDDTYLLFQADAVSDIEGNLALAMAYQASGFIRDETSPQVTSFNFDLNVGEMTVTFSEPVEMSSVQVNAFVLAQREDSTDTPTFNPSSSTVSNQSLRAIEITFERDELNEIKRLRICNDITSCYLYLSPSATVSDHADNIVQPIPASQGLRVTNFTTDTSPPFLTLFSVIDLNAGSLDISFSETLNLSSFIVTEIRLQDSPSPPIKSSLTLTGGSLPNEDSDVVTISLTTEDLNTIKIDETLCTSFTDCWIRFSSSLVSDLSGNPVIPGLDGRFDTNYRANRFIPDMTPPLLNGFDLDLNVGVMSLYFEEPVVVATFSPLEITIQNAVTATQSYQLMGGTFDDSLKVTFFTFDLTNDDVITLKANTQLATSAEDTYITFTSDMISDTNANGIQPAIDGVQVSVYTPDMIQPELDTFTLLDMNIGSLVLQFSEPINLDAVDPAGITICSNMNCSIEYTLTSIVKVLDIGTLESFVRLNLSVVDLREIKLRYDTLAASEETSWIALEAVSFTDTAGNQLIPVVTQAESFTGDTTDPSLTAFDLDVNSGILSLTFDDIIDITSVQAQEITFQSEGPGQTPVRLTGAAATPTLSENGITVLVELLPQDLDSIRLAAPSLGTSTDNTYISIASNTVQDIVGNPSNSITLLDALQATSVTPFFLECINGGTFVQGELTCQCVEGYGDTRCETDLPFCTSDTCSNGGTCIEGVGTDTTCECLDDYDGIRCEFFTGTPLCPEELDLPVYPGSSFIYSWNETEAGITLSLECPVECQDVVRYSEGAALTRECVEVDLGTAVAEWRAVDLSGCQLSRAALDLCEAANLLEVDVETAAEMVVNITANTSEVDVSAVSVAGNIVEDLTDAAIENEQVRESYLDIIDNLIEVDPEVIAESQMESNASTKILESLERFTDAVPIPDNATEREVTFARDNFGIIVQEVDPDTFDGEAFSANLGPVDEAVTDPEDLDPDDLVRDSDALLNATASVEVPSSIFGDSTSNDSQRLSYSIFLLSSLFQTPEVDCNAVFAIGSAVLAVRANASAVNLTAGLLLSFQQLEQVCNGMRLSEALCANYDSAGRWSQDNCRKVKSGDGSTSCECSQLGHFGLLFDLNPGESLSPIALAVITYVGATLSTVCLIIIIFTYLFSKKLRTSEHGQLLVNLSIALIGLYIAFLIAGHVTTVTVLCGLVSALLHYFVLVFFGWTAAEAIHLYQKLVTVLGSQIQHYVLKAALIVWLAPLLVVGISVGAGHDYYTNSFFCRPTEYPFWFGLILPFGVIYIFDWVMFSIIMVSLVKRTRRVSKLTTEAKGQMAQTKRLAIIALGLSVVFGLGWGLGLAATSSDVEEVTFTFQVIFSIFVGSQGILIFILHGLRSPDARLVWKTWFSCFPCAKTGKKYDLSHSTSKAGDGSTLKSAPTSGYRLSTLKRDSQSFSEVPKSTAFTSIPETSIQEVEEGRAEKLDLAEGLGDEVTPSSEAVAVTAAATAMTLAETTEPEEKTDEKETADEKSTVIENIGAVPPGDHDEPSGDTIREEDSTVIKNIAASTAQVTKESISGTETGETPKEEAPDKGEEAPDKEHSATKESISETETGETPKEEAPDKGEESTDKEHSATKESISETETEETPKEEAPDKGEESTDKEHSATKESISETETEETPKEEDPHEGEEVPEGESPGKERKNDVPESETRQEEKRESQVPDEETAL